MSNSALISYTKLSPNHSGKRTKKIDTITIHCMAGQLSVESCGALFAQSSRQASSNYGIGNDGRIALYVDEGNRSWCTSSNANDQRAVTIEVASDATHPYAVNSKAYDALLDLVTDICKRNGITKLVWSTNKNDRMNHLNGCNMTVHRDYANKACPGDWLYNRHGEIAAEVNRRLGSSSSTPSTGGTTGSAADIKVGDVVEFTGSKHYVSATATSASSCKPGKAKVTAIAKGKAHPYHLIAVSGGGSTVYGWTDAADIKTSAAATATSYLVKVTTDVLNIRKGPGTNYGTNGDIRDKGVYTIVAESDGPAPPCGSSLNPGPAGSRWTTPRRSNCAVCHRHGADRRRPEAIKPSEHTKRARSGVIPGGLFLFMRSFLCGVILCQILAVLALCCLSSGQLGLGRMEADDIAVDIIEAAEGDREDVHDPTDPEEAGRQRPDDARANLPHIVPMHAERAEKNAQGQDDRLAFRRGGALRCRHAGRPLAAAGRVRQARAGHADGRVAFPGRADRVLQPLRAEGDARALFIQVHTDAGGDLYAAPKP